MPNFLEHLRKSNENLVFLEKISNFDNYWDWKVTVSFYVALHLINAHIAKKIDAHYRSHNKVENAINPFNEMSPTKLNDDIYKSYIKLQNLSRRARYLVHDKPDEKSDNVFFTYDKHFKKSIIHLDNIISFFENEYNYHLNTIQLPKYIEVNEVNHIKFH